MVEPCQALIDFSLNCEWSNISTMIIELTIAFIMAGILSTFFYRRQKRDQKNIQKLQQSQKEIRLDFALNRIRSYLATLVSLNNIFLNAPKQSLQIVFVDDDILSNLDLKNECVRKIQNTINQASDVLEMHWISNINDICDLATNNPKVTKGKITTMNCESCQGIISQITETLKHLPNPPV